MARTITKTQARQIEAQVAAWLGERINLDRSPAPTGLEAYRNAQGAWLQMDGSSTGTGQPTFILEGGPEDWTFECANDLQDWALDHGMFLEPYSSWALTVYRED